MTDTIKMTEAMWQTEMRHAMWAERDAQAAYRRAITYRERMLISGEVNGWVEARNA